MRNRVVPRDDELVEVLQKHIWYELARLVLQYKLMRNPETYRNALGKDDGANIDDALIVSFCTHARNILEFFFRTDHKKWGYALAIDYAEDEADYKPLEYAKVEGLYGQLCGQINHLTYGRTDGKNKIDVTERDKLIRIIRDEVERLVKDHLKPGLKQYKQYFALHLLDETAQMLTKTAR